MTAAKALPETIAATMTAAEASATAAERANRGERSPAATGRYILTGWSWSVFLSTTSLTR